MGLIIRGRADQLTLSRESRNKPEEKGALKHIQQHSWEKWRLQQTMMSQWSGVDAVCWITTPLWTNCLKGFLVAYVLFRPFIFNPGCEMLLSCVVFQHQLSSWSSLFLRISLFVMLWFLSNSLFPPITQYFSFPIVLCVPGCLFRCPLWGCCSEHSWSHPFLLPRHKPSAPCLPCLSLSLLLSLSLSFSAALPILQVPYILGVAFVNEEAVETAMLQPPLHLFLNYFLKILKSKINPTVVVERDMLCSFFSCSVRHAWTSRRVRVCQADLGTLPLLRTGQCDDCVHLT